MNSSHVTRDLARKGLALSIMLTFVGVAPAYASGSRSQAQSSNTNSSTPQTARQKEEGTTGKPKQLATVVVTGSRIRRSTAETAQPVIRISRAQLIATGSKNLGQILTNLPDVGYVSGGFASSSFSGTGSEELSMHHLGSNRVLILLNGQRLAAGFGGAVDLNQIPLAAVQRIEVLRDGASAIYGSDAIAGVVNIITRKNYSGTTLTAYTGVANGSGHWDGHRQQFSIVTGMSNDHGHIMFTASVRNRDGIPTWHRGFSSYNPILGNTRGTSYTPQGRFIFNPPSGGDPNHPNNPPAAYTGLTLAQCPDDQVAYNGATLFLPSCDLTIKKGTSGQNPADYVPFTPQDRYVGVDNGKHRHVASNTDNMLTDYQNVKSIYTQGGLNLLSHLTGNFSALYTSRDTHGNRVTGLDGLSNAGVVIGADSPFNPFGFPLTTTEPIEVAPGVFRPTLTSIFRKFNEFGLRDRIHKSTTLRLSAGLKGRFELAGSFWHWNVGYIYSRNKIISAETNVQNGGALSVASSPACAVTPDCVPFNWFGGQGIDGKGSITPAMMSYVGLKYDILGIETKHLRSVSVNLSTSDLFELPAGGVGLALGAQRRTVAGVSVPDPTSVLPSVSNPTPAKLLKGSYDVKSTYLELNVPVLAGLPGAQRLDVDAATRYSKYNTFGSTTNSRVALAYQPIKSVLVRASWSEGFRAPNISELFSPQFTDFPYVLDPCSNYSASGVPAAIQANCAAGGVPASYRQPFNQLTGRFGGNPNLQPETSKSKTLGIVYSPSWLDGFSINADYYHIALKHSIGAIDSQQIFDFCYRGGVQRFCDLIHRRAGGFVTQIDDLTTNIGGISTEGVDFGAFYHFSSPIGQFRIGARASRTNFYNITTPTGTGGINVVKVVGNLNNGDIPRWKANLMVNYKRGRWTVNITGHYFGSIGDGRCSDELDGTSLSLANLGFCSAPNLQQNSLSINSRPPLVWWDLQVGWNAPLNVDLQLGVRNALDAKPEAGRVGYGYVEALDYGVLEGRVLYFQAQYHFGS